MSTVLKKKTQAKLHPLVLLNVLDHYQRVAKGTKKRVVGCLIGDKSEGHTDVSNSFAVPFDENTKKPYTSFLDFDYLKEMGDMFKAVNASEKVVGWYSTGVKIKAIDADIQAQMATICDDPIFVIVDPAMKNNDEIPVLVYHSVIQVREGGMQMEFDIVDCEFRSSEVEEVAVEHLLRDVQQHKSVTTLEKEVEHKVTGLRGLKKRLNDIKTYLEKVESKQLPLNQEILHNIQTIFNLKSLSCTPSFSEAMQVQTNDHALAVYIASLTRTTLILDKLLDNRIMNRDMEKKKWNEKQSILEEQKKKAKNASGKKDPEAEGKNEQQESDKKEKSSSGDAMEEG